jgi:hypothetical protein
VSLWRGVASGATTIAGQGRASQVATAGQTYTTWNTTVPPWVIFAKGHDEKIAVWRCRLLDRFLRRCRPGPLPLDVGDRSVADIDLLQQTSPARTVATHATELWNRRAFARSTRRPLSC